MKLVLLTLFFLLFFSLPFLVHLVLASRWWGSRQYRIRELAPLCFVPQIYHRAKDRWEGYYHSAETGYFEFVVAETKQIKLCSVPTKAEAKRVQATIQAEVAELRKTL